MRENGGDVWYEGQAMKRSKGYTITEASRKLGITRQAVHDAIQKGNLQAKKTEVTQTVWLIPKAALKKYQKNYSRKRPKK